MNLIEKFVYLLAWLRIFISPFSAGIIIGFLFWLHDPNPLKAKIIAGGIAFIGIILGIVWAEIVRRKSDTVEFISRVSATPELDNDEEKIK